MSLPLVASLRRFPLWRPLQSRNFALLFTGDVISLIGSQFTSVALAWLALQITGSALALGTVLLVGSIPRVLLMLAGGAITDRFPPRAILLASNALGGLLVATVAVLTFLHAVQLWHLYAVSLIFGAVGSFSFPAFFTLIPLTLDEELLGAGNALMDASNGLSQFVGPALGGLVVATGGRTSGTALALAVDAASYGVALLSLLMMSGLGRGANASGGEVRASGGGFRALLGSVREGIQYAARDPGLRTFLILLSVNNLCFYGPFRVGLAALSIHRFAGGAATLGALYGAWGAGALVGTLAAGLTNRWRRYGILQLLGAAISGTCFVLIGLAPSAVIAMALIVIQGVQGGAGNVVFGTWLQVRTDPSMLGRVMSLVGLANMGLMPVSFAASGALSDLNPTITFILAGGLTLLVTALAATSSTVRSLP